MSINRGMDKEGCATYICALYIHIYNGILLSQKKRNEIAQKEKKKGHEKMLLALSMTATCKAVLMGT